MTTPTGYQIKVKGQLDPCWSEWFDGLAISHEADGSTIFRACDGSGCLVWDLAQVARPESVASVGEPGRNRLKDAIRDLIF